MRRMRWFRRTGEGRFLPIRDPRPCGALLAAIALLVTTVLPTVGVAAEPASVDPQPTGAPPANALDRRFVDVDLVDATLPGLAIVVSMADAGGRETDVAGSANEVIIETL